MKKIVLMIVLMCYSVVVVQANVFNNDGVRKYQQALVYYKNQNYGESYRLLSQLYLSKLSDANLNFYLGRSAYEIGKYEMALAAFERVEMLEPQNLRNKLEMARTYYMLQMYENAKNYLQDVLSYPNLPKNVRRNVEFYLTKVKKKDKKSFTYAHVSLEFLYDSNVNYGSLDSQYNVSVGTLPSEPEKSDSAYQLYGDVTNLYDLGEKNGFVLKNRFLGMMTNYKEEKNYNLRYIGYMPSLLYKERKRLFELAFGVDSLGIAKQEYLRTLQIVPRVEYGHSNTLKSIVTFKYKRKRFQREQEKDLDAHHYEVAYSMQEILTPRSFLQGNFIALKEKKIGGSRIDVNYAEYKFSLNYAKALSTGYSTELLAQLRKRKYEDFSTLFASTRSDTAGMVALTLHAEVMDQLHLNIKGMYNRVHSNQARFSYKKYTLSCGVNKTF